MRTPFANEACKDASVCHSSVLSASCFGSASCIAWTNSSWQSFGALLDATVLVSCMCAFTVITAVCDLQGDLDEAANHEEQLHDQLSAAASQLAAAHAQLATQHHLQLTCGVALVCHCSLLLVKQPHGFGSNLCKTKLRCLYRMLMPSLQLLVHYFIVLDSVSTV